MNSAPKAAAASRTGSGWWGHAFLENAMLVGILGWVVIGLIVGFVASKAVNLRGDDPRFGIAAAVGGAFVAGVFYRVISGVALTPWNPWSLLLAAVGAVVAVIAWHAVRSRTISHAHQSSRSSY